MGVEMSGLPRAIIKKYGVSKKAWAVYRGTRSSTKRTRRTRKTRRRSYMARRGRRFGRRSRGGGKKVFGLSTKGLIGSYGILGAVGGAFFADQIAGMIPIDVPFKNYIAAYAVGGPAGIAGKVGKDMFMGGATSGGSWNF